MLTQTQPRSRQLVFGLPFIDLTMLLVVIIWGANFAFIKVSLEQIPPLAFTSLRFDLAAIVMLIILRLREGAIRFPTGRSFWRLAGLGLLGSTIYQIFFTLSLAITTASNGALLIATAPAMVALFGAALGIERLTRNIGLGILLAFLGVTFVVAANGLSFSWQNLHGDLLMVIAALIWASYTLGVRKLEAGPSALAITTLTMVIGAIGLTVVSLPDLVRVSWGTITLPAWGGLVYASLLGLVVAYFLWNNSVRMVGSSRTAIYGCGIPLVAALVAWPVLGEQPTLLQGMGAAFIVAGVLLTRRT